MRAASYVSSILVVAGVLMSGPCSTVDAREPKDAPKNTCEVTSADDSGPGTLRDCLLNAQNGDVVTFNPAEFPPATPNTILLYSELPALTSGNIFIDAFGAGVILDGSATTGSNGLTILSDDNRVRGLEISGFPMYGIYIDGGGNVIDGHLPDPNEVPAWNIVTGCGTGIGVFGGDPDNNNFIGKNVIGDCDVGIRIAPADPQAANHVIVVGNTIGADQIYGSIPNEIGVVVSSDHGHDFKHNHLMNNDVGIRVESDASLSAMNNCVVGNTTGVSHAGSAIDLDLERNWWGAEDGPSGVGPGSGDSIELIGTGTVDFVPWLPFECGQDFIFVDTFESGDTSEWSTVVP